MEFSATHHHFNRLHVSHMKEQWQRKWQCVNGALLAHRWSPRSAAGALIYLTWRFESLLVIKPYKSQFLCLIKSSPGWRGTASRRRRRLFLANNEPLGGGVSASKQEAARRQVGK